MTDSSFTPTEENLLAAQQVLMSEPAMLANALQYAIQHIKNDFMAHPEDAEDSQDELEQLMHYRMRFLAALRGQNIKTMSTDEAWEAMLWMMKENLDPEEP